MRGERVAEHLDVTAGPLLERGAAGRGCALQGQAAAVDGQIDVAAREVLAERDVERTRLILARR